MMVLFLLDRVTPRALLQWPGQSICFLAGCGGSHTSSDQNVDWHEKGFVEANTATQFGMAVNVFENEGKVFTKKDAEEYTVVISRAFFSFFIFPM
jgi:hypothetical protein